jgi:hypothetical protein
MPLFHKKGFNCLPYIGWDQGSNHFPLYPDTFPVKFTNSYLLCDSPKSYVDSLEDYRVGIGKSVLTIANCIGRIGYYFLLDTKRRAITMATPMEPTDPIDLSQNWDVRLNTLWLFTTQVENADSHITGGLI